MRRNRCLRLAHQQPPGHAKMNNPLQLFIIAWLERWPCLTFKIEHDMLANSPNPLNSPSLEQLQHLRRRRLKGLRFETEPD